MRPGDHDCNESAVDLNEPKQRYLGTYKGCPLLLGLNKIRTMKTVQPKSNILYLFGPLPGAEG